MLTSRFKKFVAPPSEYSILTLTHRCTATNGAFMPISAVIGCEERMQGRE